MIGLAFSLVRLIASSVGMLDALSDGLKAIQDPQGELGERSFHASSPGSRSTVYSRYELQID